MRAHSGASASIPTCDVPKTVADILTAAAVLIEPEGAWTRDAFARNAAGENTGMSEFRGRAVCWCILGATEKVAPKNSDDADEFLARCLGVSPGEWNDAPERTQAEVVAALRAAAEKARTAVEGPQPGTQPGLPGEVKQSPANQEQGQSE